MYIRSLLEATLEGMECKALKSSPDHVVLDTNYCLVKQVNF